MLSGLQELIFGSEEGGGVSKAMRAVLAWIDKVQDDDGLEHWFTLLLAFRKDGGPVGIAASANGSW